MKRKLWLLVPVVMFCGIVTARAQTVDEIINKHLWRLQKLPEGIVYPMSVDGGLSIKSIETNKPIDENFFKPGK